MRSRIVWHLKRINRLKDEQGERGQRIESSMLCEWQSLCPSCLCYDSIVLWWRQESKFRGGGQWVCVCEICLFLLSHVSVIVNLTQDSMEVSAVCLVLCSVPNLVRSCWYSSFLWNKMSETHQTVQQVTKAYHFTILGILLEINIPYWPCTRLEETVERV